MKLELRVSDVGITLDTAQQVWEGAAELLQTQGILVTHTRLRKDLEGKPGIELRGGRARITRQRFESAYPSPRALHGQRKSQTNLSAPSAEPKRDIAVSCGGFAMDVVDWRTGELRPATVRDLIESVRVVEACGSRGPYCVTPQDVPPLLRDVVTWKVCFEHALKIRGHYYSTSGQSRFIERMCEVMSAPFSLILGTLSPLKMSDGDLDNIYDAADRGKTHPIEIVGYGVPGVGSPAVLAASAALVMAENYGAAILLSCAFPGRAVRAGVSAGGATDFRYCNYALGAPHAFAYNIVNSHLNAALRGRDPLEGVPVPVGALFTGSCLPDEQAAAEKSAHAMLSALLGARDFAVAGNLCVDDVFSLEQFMIDREIAEHAVKTVECCEPSTLMADLSGFAEEIDRVMAGELFLALPSTIRVMKAFYKPSSVFEHMKLRLWQGSGARAARDKARERIEDKLRAPHFRLDSARTEALDRIYSEAEKTLT